MGDSNASEPREQAPRIARLISVARGAFGRVYSVGAGGAVLGRDEAAEIQIEGGDISRRHARITGDGAGRWTIEDLESRNGTRVNGVPISRHQLSFGDRIHLGETAMFLFARYDAIEERVLELQKMEAVGQLAGGVAHDFNNLLSVIQGNMAFLEGELQREDFDRAEALACVAESRTAIQRAAEVTRQLLGFSRKVVSEDAPVDLVALAEEVAQLCRRTFHKRVAIEVVAQAPAAAVGNRGQLHQVLMNLCINARDAMPDGGAITITVRREQLPFTGESTPFVVPLRQCAVLSIADEGCGMDAKTRARIFEPFFSTKADKGTGLGLATAYNIVKRHGGEIEVKSSPGAGTTFRVVLPAADALADPPRTLLAAAAVDVAQPPTCETEVPQLPERCVLLVDDEATIRQATGRLLQSWGYTVLPAEDGHEAVAIYERNRPQIGCVLLDVVMPRLDGRETLRILRSIDRDVRVVLTSGKMDATAVADLLDRVEAFLPKPHARDELRPLLELIFAEREQAKG